MDQKDKEELAELFTKTIQMHLPPETHREHHDFVQALIQKENRKQELWENVKAQVLGWGVIGSILLAIGAFGAQIKDWLFK
jgi:hypothetical protein